MVCFLTTDFILYFFTVSKTFYYGQSLPPPHCDHKHRQKQVKEGKIYLVSWIQKLQFTIVGKAWLHGQSGSKEITTGIRGYDFQGPTPWDYFTSSGPSPSTAFQINTVALGTSIQ